jgi:hypothetical protein
MPWKSGGQLGKERGSDDATNGDAREESGEAVVGGSGYCSIAFCRVNGDRSGCGASDAVGAAT